MRRNVDREGGSQGDDSSKPTTPNTVDTPSSPGEPTGHGEGHHSDTCSSVGGPMSPKESSGTQSPSNNSEHAGGRSEHRTSSPPAGKGLAGAMAALVGSDSEGVAGMRRVPIDMLCRVFPHMKRSVLQLILQGCNGDVVQAIEQVLNNHNTDHSPGSMPTTTGLSPPEGLGLAAGGVSHRPYMTSASPVINSNGLKSAFSPITSLASAASVAAAAAASNPLRYAYPPAAARGLALAMPYPPGFMPNLASLGYSYAAGGLAAAQKGSLPYPLCPTIPCPYPNPNDK